MYWDPEFVLSQSPGYGSAFNVCGSETLINTLTFVVKQVFLQRSALLRFWSGKVPRTGLRVLSYYQYRSDFKIITDPKLDPDHYGLWYFITSTFNLPVIAIRYVINSFSHNKDNLEPVIIEIHASFIFPFFNRAWCWSINGLRIRKINGSETTSRVFSIGLTSECFFCSFF